MLKRQKPDSGQNSILFDPGKVWSRLGLALFFLPLLVVSQTAVAMTEDVPPLPDDNLIQNPWFRDAANTTGSHDGWQVTEAWGLSQKESNPTFDGVQGTSARIGTPRADYDEPHIISQVVTADPDKKVLVFQMWQVSRNLNELSATLFGSSSPDGPWEEIWQPWVQTQSSIHWRQTPLFEIELDQGYPFYKLELMCNYSGGIAGCKYTGVFFKVTDALGEGVEAAAPPTPMTPIETDEDANVETIDLQLEALLATAISDDSISITWPQHGQTDVVYQIQRSANGRNGWEIIAQVAATEWAYIDRNLSPEAEYFYRIQANVEGGGRLRSPIISATTMTADPPSSTSTPLSENVTIDPTATSALEVADLADPTPKPPDRSDQADEPAAPTEEARLATPLAPFYWLFTGFGAGILIVGGVWFLQRRKAN